MSGKGSQRNGNGPDDSPCDVLRNEREMEGKVELGSTHV